MSAVTQDTAVSTGRVTRAFIYLVLILFALFYLLPLYVMGVNSVKPLAHMRSRMDLTTRARSIML